MLNFANNFANLLSPLPKWLLAAKEAEFSKQVLVQFLCPAKYDIVLIELNVENKGKTLTD